MEFLGNADDRCVIAPQYPVSWWTRLFWHVGFGLVRSVVDFVGGLVFSENVLFCVVENVVSIGSTVVMIHTHYPVSRRLVLVYLSGLTIFIQFVVEDTNATVVGGLDKIALMFHWALFLLDFAIWVTGSTLV